MRPIIEFCVNNMHHGTDVVKKQLELNKDYDVIEYGCLGNCGECYLSPYALVNGEVIGADSSEQLQQVIVDKIKQLEELDRLLDE